MINLPMAFGRPFRASSPWLRCLDAARGPRGARPGGANPAIDRSADESHASRGGPERQGSRQAGDSMPQPHMKAFARGVASAKGASSVRLPRSVHAALLAEAEGISLNQLCVVKLVAQLPAVV
jgi:hypothetical protein